MNHHLPSVTLLQASQNDPTLARLMDIHRQSSERLQAVSALIPSALHTAVKAGPLQDGVWCLLLANTATAAKMRQLLPALEAHLRVCGLPVQSIRLKISRGG